MAFGQQTGPPASSKQVELLTHLLDRAGYSSFREARHIFGLTQRQASGRFTQDEADELIGRLEQETGGEAEPETVAPRAAGRRAGSREADRQAEVLAAVPAEDLADELVRRGWMCVPPS